MRMMKKIGIVLTVLAILAGYLVIGAAAPFIFQKKVSNEAAYSGKLSIHDVNTQAHERAMLLETNESALTERIRLLNQAQSEIIMTTFDMRPGESTKDVACVLLKKAEEGIHIRILVDGISGFLRMEGEPLFYALSSHPNIEMKLYNPINVLLPWKTQGRMHDKYIMVDETAYILGGRNMFDYFVGNYPTAYRSFDREVLVYLPDGSAGEQDSFTQLKQYFEKMWEGDVCKPFHDSEKLAERKSVSEAAAELRERYTSLREQQPQLFDEYDYTANTYETENIQLISNPTGIYGKEPVVFYQLTDLMQQAEKRVIIHTPYIVCNTYMYSRLKMVTQAVPDTRILYNSVANGDNFVASSDYLYNKRDIIETGAQLYEYNGGNSYHGKSVVIDDDISIIGSYNFDMRSTYVDTELMLMIKSKPLTEELSGYMEVYEANSNHVLTEDTYDENDRKEPPEVPAGKMFLHRGAGLLFQLFRYII